MHPSSTSTDCCKQTAAVRNNTSGDKISIPTLQELAGDVIRKQVEEERKDIVRKHSDSFKSKKQKLELQREELQRQLREVEEQMKWTEIECHKDMLTELDHFDRERQPEMLDILTDTGQLDRICPLCENFFRSSTESPECCMGPEQCHLSYSVHRYCFSCSRLSFHDIFQYLAMANSTGKANNNQEPGGLGIVEDLATLETAASTPTWMLEQIFGEEARSIRQQDGDESEESAKNLAAEAIRLVLRS